MTKMTWRHDQMHFQMDVTGRNRQLYLGNKLMQVELGMHPVVERGESLASRNHNLHRVRVGSLEYTVLD
jgi:hypothetical protein